MTLVNLCQWVVGSVPWRSGPDAHCAAEAGSRRGAASVRPELVLFGAAILLFNVPLLWRVVPWAWVYLPGSLRSGEWWRLLTHPFVHVSGYHLALDATAFLLLYAGLVDVGRRGRLLTLGLCGAASLAVSVVFAPEQVVRGFCGLSGIAHGLMAFTCLDAVCRPPRDRVVTLAGAVGFVLLVAKACAEAAIGAPVLAALHLGPVGDPVTVCHAGGVLGGVAAFAVMTLRTVRRGSA